MTPQDMLTLLKGIEWDGSEDTYLCPSCHASKQSGHEKHCRLAHHLALLRHEIRREQA